MIRYRPLGRFKPLHLVLRNAPFIEDDLPFELPILEGEIALLEGLFPKLLPELINREA